MTTNANESHSRRHAAPAPHNVKDVCLARRRRDLELQEAHRRELVQGTYLLEALVRSALDAFEEGDMSFLCANLHEAKAVSARVFELAQQNR